MRPTASLCRLKCVLIHSSSWLCTTELYKCINAAGINTFMMHYTPMAQWMRNVFPIKFWTSLKLKFLLWLTIWARQFISMFVCGFHGMKCEKMCTQCTDKYKFTLVFCVFLCIPLGLSVFCLHLYMCKCACVFMWSWLFMPVCVSQPSAALDRMGSAQQGAWPLGLQTRHGDLHVNVKIK